MNYRVMLTWCSLLTFLTGCAALPVGGTQTLHANWASSATQFAEVATEADLIVRVQVQRVLPPYERSSTSSLPNPPRSATMLFTRSDMRVMTVYKGQASEHITIFQTGGTETNALGFVTRNLFVADDPIYQVGEEYVLFLVDISDDAIHGRQGETLYRIVNPAGRYQIRGEQVMSYAEPVARDAQPALSADALAPTAAPLPLPTTAPASDTPQDASPETGATQEDEATEQRPLPTRLDELVTEIASVQGAT